MYQIMQLSYASEDVNLKNRFSISKTKTNEIDGLILKLTVSDHDSNTGHDWADAPTPAPNLVPQLTSTAIKRRRPDEESLGGPPSEQGSEQDFQDS